MQHNAYLAMGVDILCAIIWEIDTHVIYFYSESLSRAFKEICIEEEIKDVAEVLLNLVSIIFMLSYSRVQQFRLCPIGNSLINYSLMVKKA